MMPQWLFTIVFMVMMIVFMAMGIHGIVVAARTYLRRQTSAEEFGKLFLKGWSSAGMVAIATLFFLQQLLVEVSPKYLLFAFAGFWLYVPAGYFATWVATRRYQRTIAHPDFAEDESGNPVRSAAPAAPDEEVIETWDDLVRAQRRRRRPAVPEDETIRGRP